MADAHLNMRAFVEIFICDIFMPMSLDRQLLSSWNGEMDSLWSFFCLNMPSHKDKFIPLHNLTCMIYYELLRKIL